MTLCIFLVIHIASLNAAYYLIKIVSCHLVQGSLSFPYLHAEVVLHSSQLLEDQFGICWRSLTMLSLKSSRNQLKHSILLSSNIMVVFVLAFNFHYLLGIQLGLLVSGHHSHCVELKSRENVSKEGF